MRTAAAARPTIGDRATSDVVVRLRTPEGRDEWLYCHSAVLAAGSGYFADRLSDAWPTCQILDSRYCVEVRCADPDLSSHVNALRLLYPSAGHDPVSRFGVRGALALLRAAAHLACGRIATACADYLESAPWDEADEEEILAAVPCLAGDQYDRVLARLRPADPAPATAIFLSAFRHATAPPAAAAASRELKSAAQEQLEYMLTEDDDAPLLAFDADGGSGAVKSQVKDCVAGLLNRFSDFTSSVLTKQMEAPCSGDGELQQELHSFVSDISWVCQVLGKLEMMKCLAAYWIGASSDVVAAVEVACPGSECLKTRMKVVEISAKVLEAVAFGNVVLPLEKRCHAVNVWIRFAGITKHFVDQANRGNGEETHNGDDGESHNGDEGNNGDAEAAAKTGLDSEVWQGLESAITSIVMTLPSNPQAEILSEWLQSKHAAFLDLTEAFDAWCYRSKVAGRRLSFLNNSNLTS